jgi:hypothetical protein
MKLAIFKIYINSFYLLVFTTRVCKNMRNTISGNLQSCTSLDTCDGLLKIRFELSQTDVQLCH